MTNNHIAIGFYPNGDYKINIVADADLKDNIEYNKKWRPGRFYFVDGEYVCGGLLNKLEQCSFIESCKEKIKSLNIDNSKITKTYE